MCGISGIRGAEALQYPTNFAFRTKVINDACIDRVPLIILFRIIVSKGKCDERCTGDCSIVIFNRRITREVRAEKLVVSRYVVTCIYYKRINYNAIGRSLLRIASASAKCTDESREARKFGVTLRIRNFGEVHYILVIA